MGDLHEEIVSDHPREPAFNAPPGKGNERRCHRASLLDEGFGQFTLHVRWGIAVHCSEKVERTLTQPENFRTMGHMDAFSSFPRSRTKDDAPPEAPTILKAPK